jgi:DNA-binding IclR family transcriptional regulator
MPRATSAREPVSTRGRNATADRAIDILLLFSDERPLFTAEEIAERLGMSRSTTYRYLQGLRAYGLVEEGETNGRFRLGPAIVRLARVARKGMGLPDVALPIMRELTAKTGETSLLTRRAGQQVICIERVESTHSVRLSYERGNVLPLHAGASANILLAYMTPVEIEAVIASGPLIRFTEHTVTDAEQLHEQLAQIRRQGYSMTDGAVDVGVRGVAAPIRGPENAVLAAISVAGPAFRLNDQRLPEVIAEVCAAAGEISRQWAEMQA